MKDEKETPAEEPKEEIIEKTDVEKRKEEYEALKAENDNVEKELLRREQLKAEVAKGGKSDAGQVPKKKSEDEEWEEKAKERYAGTGMDPTPDNTETQFI